MGVKDNKFKWKKMQKLRLPDHIIHRKMHSEITVMNVLLSCLS